MLIVCGLELLGLWFRWVSMILGLQVSKALQIVYFQCPSKESVTGTPSHYTFLGGKSLHESSLRINIFDQTFCRTSESILPEVI